MLFRFAFIDALVALIMVVAVVFYAMQDPFVLSILAEMEIEPSVLFKIDDLIWLAGAGFGTAVFCAVWVVMRFREEM
jgi:hypothetical protein